MGYMKCPRCELNYMLDTEKMCEVCKKDLSGEYADEDMVEMCSICGENPVIPGQEVCAMCLKENQRSTDMSSTDDSVEVVSMSGVDSIDSMSGMEELADPSENRADAANEELSLDAAKEEEEAEDEEPEEE